MNFKVSQRPKTIAFHYETPCIFSLEKVGTLFISDILQGGGVHKMEKNFLCISGRIKEFLATF